MTEAISITTTAVRSGKPSNTEQQIAFDELAVVYERNLKRFCPVNKNRHAPNPGALRRSIKKVREPGQTDTLTYDFEALSYARFVIYGTDEHDIPLIGGPKTILAFPWDVRLPSGSGQPTPRLDSQKRNFKWDKRGRGERLADTPGLNEGGARKGARHYGRVQRDPGTGRFRRQQFVHGKGDRLGKPTGVTSTQAFFARVHHPGTQPNNFVEKAMYAPSTKAAEERLMDTYTEHLDATLWTMPLTGWESVI